MQIYRSLHAVRFSVPCWVSVGTFDGVHLGHQAILGRLVDRAHAEKRESVVITFEPHPQNVVQSSRRPVFILTPVEEKLALLEPVGVHAVVVLPFTETLAQVSPEAFIQKVVQSFTIAGMVSGRSHVFGSARSGNAELLEVFGRQFHFVVEIVPPLFIGNESVSSTRLRRLLREGDIQKANRFLGRHYSVAGHVVKGQRMGTKLGFPTANLQPEGEAKLIPGDGVYAVMIKMGDQTIPGTANIGTCPTVDKKERVFEVHIHDWFGDLYDRRLVVDFICRLRDEKKFKSLEALKEQIKRDQQKTQQLLSRIL